MAARILDGEQALIASCAILPASVCVVWFLMAGDSPSPGGDVAMPKGPLRSGVATSPCGESPALVNNLAVASVQDVHGNVEADESNKKEKKSRKRDAEVEGREEP